MIGNSGTKDKDIVAVDALAATLVLTSLDSEELALDLTVTGSATLLSAKSQGRKLCHRTEHIVLLEKKSN